MFKQQPLYFHTEKMSFNLEKVSLFRSAWCHLRTAEPATVKSVNSTLVMQVQRQELGRITELLFCWCVKTIHSSDDHFCALSSWFLIFLHFFSFLWAPTGALTCTNLANRSWIQKQEGGFSCACVWMALCHRFFSFSGIRLFFFKTTDLIPLDRDGFCKDFNCYSPYLTNNFGNDS